MLPPLLLLPPVTLRSDHPHAVCSTTSSSATPTPATGAHYSSAGFASLGAASASSSAPAAHLAFFCPLSLPAFAQQKEAGVDRIYRHEGPACCGGLEKLVY